MNKEKIVAGVFAVILGSMAVKTFKTIIMDRKEEKEVTEDERWY